MVHVLIPSCRHITGCPSIIRLSLRYQLSYTKPFMALNSQVLRPLLPHDNFRHFASSSTHGNLKMGKINECQYIYLLCCNSQLIPEEVIKASTLLAFLRLCTTELFKRPFLYRQQGSTALNDSQNQLDNLFKTVVYITISC